MIRLNKKEKELVLEKRRIDAVKSMKARSNITLKDAIRLIKQFESKNSWNAPY